MVSNATSQGWVTGGVHDGRDQPGLEVLRGVFLVSLEGGVGDSQREKTGPKAPRGDTFLRPPPSCCKGNNSMETPGEISSQGF